MNDLWRKQAASIAALSIISALALAPWLFSDTALSLDSEIELPTELLKQLPDPCRSLYLYVGYPGCRTECPKALSEIALRLRHTHETSPRQCFVFLSLFPNQEEATAQYAKSFHPDLIGVSLAAQELSPMLHSLGLRSKLNGEGRHKDWLYSFSKRRHRWRLTGVTKDTSNE